MEVELLELFPKLDGRGFAGETTCPPIVSDRPSQLSERAAAFLEMIAAGCSYEQIMSAHPHITYLDIFDAAREALDLSVAPQFVPPAPPRANAPWTERDDAALRRHMQYGLKVAQIANRLQRQRSAIRARILKLNLVDQPSPHEQSELHRISALDPKEPGDDL